MEIPVYNIVFDENNEISGIQTVSLVNDPAIESNFIALSKEKQNLKFNKLKQIVTGPVLIPNKKIIRFDDQGYPYFISFSAEQIEKLRDKFHRDKLTDKTNLEHKENLSRSDLYVLESWIVSDSEKDKSQAIGLEKLPVGSWVLSYKIPDQEVFSKVLSGELNGFSIEAFLDLNIEKSQPKQEIQQNKMTKFEKFFNSMKNLFLEIDQEEVKLATYQSGELTIEVDDETGAVTSETPDGEYPVENGTLVIAEGIATFTPMEETTEEITEEVIDEIVEDESTEEETADDSPVSYILDNGDVVEVDPEGNLITEGIADGEYTLEDGSIMVVAEGRLVEILSMEAQLQKQIETLNAELSSIKTELSQIKNEKIELETKLSSLPAGKKIVTQDLGKEDFTKLSTAQKFAHLAKKSA